VGGTFVLVSVPVDVNLPANVIVHTPMYPVNITELYVATPDDALCIAPDITHAAGVTVVVTVMASCSVTTALPILNSTAATASVKGVGSRQHV
jgi:hypothetical protein